MTPLRENRPVYRSRKESAAKADVSPPKGGTAGTVARKATDVRPWRARDLAVLSAVFILAFALKEAAFSSAVFHAMPPEGRTYTRFAVLAAFYGVQIGVVALLVRRRGHTIRSAFLSEKDETAASVALDVAWVLLLLVATRLFSVAWAAGVRTLGWGPPNVNGSELSAVFGTGASGLFMALVATAVIGPAAEELVFRGAALRALVDRMGEWPSIALVSLLYAGSHLEPWVFVPTFVLGLALGWLAWRRRSLNAAIALHSLYNATAVLAAFYVAG